jgi:N utilization substance protein B
MASNRHLGRIIALQTLYEEEFRRDCNDPRFVLEEVLTRNVKRYAEMVDDSEFIEQLAPEWPIDQIARMDRIILRIGAYELLYGKNVPPKVVINEAVELAKGFGGENSSKFINGVLGTVLRQKDGGPDTKEADKEAKTA